MTECAPTLNLLDPDYRRDPFPSLAALRARDPIHRLPWGAWVFTRYNDMMALMRDPKMGRDMRKWNLYDHVATWKDHPEVARLAPMYMMNADPPIHGRIRNMMAEFFRPSGLKRLEPMVRRVAGELADQIEADSPVEFMSTFALPLPVKIICGLFDFPLEDYALLRRWSEAWAPFVEMTISPEQKDALQRSMGEFHDYLKDFLARRRRRQGSGLVDRLLEAHDKQGTLSEDEMLMNISGMLFAGHETTANLLGNGLLALARHPEQLARLRSKPELVPSVVKECLRYDPSVNIIVRIALEDVTLGDKTIKRGDLCLLMLGAANRDPEVYAQPDRFDIERDASPHATYGGGRHYCIGALLANMEAELALSTLIGRFSSVEVDEGKLKWLDRVNLRGLDNLTLTFSN